MAGSGTILDPIQITNLTGLQNMTLDRSASYKLMNDIDASDSGINGFEPIGMLAGAEFKGTFDGNGKTISGMLIVRTADSGNHYLSFLGSCRDRAYNLVQNSTFDSNANYWTLNTGWSYNGGTKKVELTADSGGTLEYPVANLLNPIAPEEYCKVKFTLTVTAGTVDVSYAGVALGSFVSADVDSQTHNIEMVSNLPLVFSPSSTARCTVDVVAIYEHRFIRDFTLNDCVVQWTGTGSARGYVGSAGSYMQIGTSLEQMVISDVIVNRPIITTTGVYTYDAGGFCSSASAGVTILDCEVNDLSLVCGGDIVSAGGFFAIGPAGGQTPDNLIYNCKVTGSVTVAGATVIGFDRYYGGFGGKVGSSQPNTKCYANVTLVITHTTTETIYIGGFAAEGGTNTQCVSDSNITTNLNGYARIGGFVGAGGWSYECVATGNIIAPNLNGLSSGVYSAVGGFVGAGGNVYDCYCSGSVLSSGLTRSTNDFIFVGGFGGNLGPYASSDCYSNSIVYPGIERAGGFSNSASSVTGCYWNKTTSNYSNAVYGTAGDTDNIKGKTSQEMQASATFVDWDFVDKWEMGEAVTNAVSASNLTVWPSKSGDYDNFLEGTKDADSFQTDIPSTNEIRWIDSQEALLIGTAGDEWKLSSNKLDTPLSPTNHGSKRQSGHGSAYLQAINVNEVILFVDSVRRKIREMAFDPNTDKYMCPDMTSLSEHITAGQIKWMAYQKNPNSILWVGLDTGDVRGFVYDREQNVTAWFKVPLGNDAACQSGCVIPGETEDEIYLIVNRTIAGSFIYAGTEQVYAGDEPVVIGGGDKVYLERFSARELISKADAFFVDCGVVWETSGAYVEQEVYSGSQPVYSGTEPVVITEFDSTAPSSTVTGLEHLNGETVKILADGVVADDAVVSNGQVTIQIGGVTTAALKASVGLAYTSKVKPMRLLVGDSLGKKTRVNSLIVSLLDTGACKYGPDSTDQRDIDLNEVGVTNTSEITGLFTGEVEVSQAAGFDPQNAIVITSDEPLPLVVRAIIVDLSRTG
jgi:hypothetical protein